MATSRRGRPRVGIIGAGPAGCAAAIALQHADARIVVFERGWPNKDKPCGDAFVPAAVEALQTIGLGATSLEELGGLPFNSVVFRRATDPGARPRLDLAKPGWVVPRQRIDQRLRDMAATFSMFLYGHEITRAEPIRESGFRIGFRTDREQGTADVDGLIVATGSISRLSATLGVDGWPVVGASLTQYARASVDAVHFSFDEVVQPGYAWLFPMASGRVNLGACGITVDANRALRAALTRVGRWFETTDVSRTRAGLAKLWSGKGTCWHHMAGALSCGDAAGLVDPGDGEGISGALMSGHMAGSALARFFAQDGNVAPLVEYSDWVKAFFTRRYEENARHRVLHHFSPLTAAQPPGEPRDEQRQGT